MTQTEDRMPLHRQLASRLVSAVLEGDLREGDALPSVRELAMHHVLNPNTVVLALEALNGQGVLDRCGQDLYLKPGAREVLRRAERERFLREEWPELCVRLDRLGIDRADLLTTTGQKVS